MQQPQYGVESQTIQQPQMTQGGQAGGGVGTTGATGPGALGYTEGGGQVQQGGAAIQPTQGIGQGGQAVQGPQQVPQRGMDLKLEDSLTENMRVALHDFVKAANVCEWCAEQCAEHGPEMAECLRLCRDVADIAAFNQKLITRDSVFGPELAEVFISAADACAQECAQHPQKHCQECAEVLTRAVKATREMLSSFQRQGAGLQGGIQQQVGGGTQQF